jgi:predicted kinase
VLYILSGLPGTGKSTLAAMLAAATGAAHLRIDTIEQALRELCQLEVVDQGYRLAFALASEHLRGKLSVVADSCNPIDWSRRAWEQVAIDAGARYVNIELCCSDQVEHRWRVEHRSSTVPGLRLPTWAEVLAREYHEWSSPRLQLDTAGRTPSACLQTLLELLSSCG